MLKILQKPKKGGPVHTEIALMPPIIHIPNIDHMENERPDFIVTTETIRRVEEYNHPTEGYELIIGIPAAFTPVCAAEMEMLNQGIEAGKAGNTVSHIVMLDSPNAVQAWLRANNWNNLEVLISDYAASSHDLKTGDLERPISRTMVVNFYEPREAEAEFEKMMSQFPMFYAPKFTRTVELLRYATHMDVPRNFQEAARVIQHHADNRI